MLAGNVKGIFEKQWIGKKSCDEVEAVGKLTYLGNRVSTG